MKYQEVYLIVNGLKVIMPELPRPPENTPPWIWVVGTSLAAFIIAATPIVLPRLLDGSSQSNTAQNTPVTQPSLSPTSQPTQSPIEYRGDPVGEMPYRENAITVDYTPTTITAPIDGVIEVCAVESKDTVEGAVYTLVQQVKIEDSYNRSETLTFASTECQDSSIRLKKGKKIKVTLTYPFNNHPNLRHPIVAFK